MKWIEAATWCQQKSGELVRVDSQSVVSMLEWYKTNEWNSFWNHHIWTGLYSYTQNVGYWEGSCIPLDYSYLASGQTFSKTTPCMYIDKDSLEWYYADCDSTNYVVCQTSQGECTFDDQGNTVDNSFTPVQTTKINTLEACKSLCSSWNGNEQCWVIKYHSSSLQCSIYTSVNPTTFFSTKKNNNKNIVYSARSCFSASIVQESAPLVSLTISSVVDPCKPLTTAVEKQSTEEGILTTSDYFKSSYLSTLISIKPLSVTVPSKDSTTLYNYASSEKTTDPSPSETTNPVISTTSDLSSNVITTSLKSEDNFTSGSDNTLTSTEGLSTSDTFASLTDISNPPQSTLYTSVSSEKTTDPSPSETTNPVIFTTSDLTSNVITTSLKSEDNFTSGSDNTFTLTEGLSTYDTFASLTDISNTPQSTTSSLQSNPPQSAITSSQSNPPRSTTTSPQSSGTCSFQCPCSFDSQNLTTEFLEKRLEELKSLLKIDKTKTNTYIRKLTSAKDDRPSSRAIGTVAVLFIACTVGLIVSADIVNLCKYINCRYSTAT